MVETYFLTECNKIYWLYSSGQISFAELKEELIRLNKSYKTSYAV